MHGATVDLLYDAAGRLMGFVNGANGAWWEEKFWGAGRLLGHYDHYLSGATYFIHRNSLGSSTEITDATGALAGDMLFYPWGQEWQYANGVNPGWWQFYGGFSRKEADLGLYLTPNRLYSPSYGRWLTADPLGGDVTNPQSLNRYAYALNSPTNLTDPMGLYSSNPADQCSNPAYAISHAECEGPPVCDGADPLYGACDPGGSPWWYGPRSERNRIRKWAHDKFRI